MAREMKNSGVDWIGDIPAEWEMKRLKAIFFERKEKNDPQQTDFILSLGAAYGVVPYSEKEGGGNKAKEDLTAYRLAYPDDIVMNSMNIISGSVGISKYFGCVSPVYYMLYPRTEGVNQHYYCQMFQTKAFQRSLLGLGNGILMKETESGNFNTVRMRIPMEKLGVQLLPIPPYEEQKRIADFLDRKCAEIDTVIEKTKATIEEYKKLKQSVITEAVTKGIRGDHPMKDSGIDWIGDIPADWDCLKAKYLFQVGDGSLKIGPFGSALSGKTLEEGPYKIYNQAHLVSNDFSLNRHFVSESTFEVLKSYEVKPGDVLFSMMGTIGKCRIMPSGYCKGIMDSHLLKARLNELVDEKYFSYVYDKDHSSIGIGQLNYYSNGSIMSGLNSTIVKNIHIPLPSLEEQKEIADFLDVKCAEIDKLIADKTHLLEEMESYKKSVIYEYVTGKKEVE